MPATVSCPRNASSVATGTKARAMSSARVGSTSSAAPPVVGSGLATTGVPYRMASTGGSPNPSSKGT